MFNPSLPCEGKRGELAFSPPPQVVASCMHGRQKLYNNSVVMSQGSKWVSTGCKGVPSMAMLSRVQVQLPGIKTTSSLPTWSIDSAMEHEGRDSWEVISTTSSTISHPFKRFTNEDGKRYNMWPSVSSDRRLPPQSRRSTPKTCCF